VVHEQTARETLDALFYLKTNSGYVPPSAEGHTIVIKEPLHPGGSRRAFTADCRIPW
jgi:hypothetical protein